MQWHGNYIKHVPAKVRIWKLLSVIDWFQCFNDVCLQISDGTIRAKF